VTTAVEAFLKGSVSVGRAAEIAEVPIQGFLVEFKRRGISAYPSTDDEALEEPMV